VIEGVRLVGCGEQRPDDARAAAGARAVLVFRISPDFHAAQLKHVLLWSHVRNSVEKESGALSHNCSLDPAACGQPMFNEGALAHLHGEKKKRQ